MNPRCSATATAVVLAVLVGCGSRSSGSTGGEKDNGESEKTGQQVADDASAALVSAGAVHIEGTFDTTDTDGKTTTLTIVMQLQTDGGTARSTSSQFSSDLVSVGGHTYVRLTSEVTALAGAAGKQFAGKWLRTDASDDAGDDDDFALAAIAEQLISDDDFGPIDPATTVTTLNGRKTVVVTSSRGGRLWVSATGRPYPLQVSIPRKANDPSPSGGTSTLESADGPGMLTFSDFGVRVPLATPSPVIDESALRPTDVPVPSAG